MGTARKDQHGRASPLLGTPCIQIWNSDSKGEDNDQTPSRRKKQRHSMEERKRKQESCGFTEDQTRHQFEDQEWEEGRLDTEKHKKSRLEHAKEHERARLEDKEKDVAVKAQGRSSTAILDNYCWWAADPEGQPALCVGYDDECPFGFVLQQAKNLANQYEVRLESSDQNAGEALPQWVSSASGRFEKCCFQEATVALQGATYKIFGIAANRKYVSRATRLAAFIRACLAEPSIKRETNMQGAEFEKLAVHTLVSLRNLVAFNRQSREQTPQKIPKPPSTPPPLKLFRMSVDKQVRELNKESFREDISKDSMDSEAVQLAGFDCGDVEFKAEECNSRALENLGQTIGQYADRCQVRQEPLKDANHVRRRRNGSFSSNCRGSGAHRFKNWFGRQRVNKKKRQRRGLREVRLHDICYSQDSHSAFFRNGCGVAEATKDLQSGKLKVTDFPTLRCVEFGKLWSLDNRRLRCFKEAFPKDTTINVMVESLNNAKIRQKFMQKFTVGSSIAER